MLFGVDVPHFGAHADARALADLAAEAEAAGWDGFFIWDHLAMWWPVEVADPWIALTAVALRTDRLRFGPLITPMARRRPQMVAREATTLDQLSGGRLILGVGLGTHPEEFERFGEAPGLKQRGERLDEALTVLDGLWRGEPFTYHGAYYQVENAEFRPTPAQQPRIPIWVAGNWPNKPPFRRAARWDGVVPLGRGAGWSDQLPPDEIAELAAFIREQRGDAPFDIVHSGISTGINAAREAEMVAAYAAAGVTWWIENLNPWRYGWSEGDPNWPAEAILARIRQGPPGRG